MWLSKWGAGFGFDASLHTLAKPSDIRCAGLVLSVSLAIVVIRGWLADR